MKKLIIALGVLIVLASSFYILNTYIYHEKQADEIVTEIPERDVHLAQFEDRSIVIAFDYPDGPDGYTIDNLSDFLDGESQDLEVVSAYRIINTKEKIELENSEGGREGPPAINLTVFKNDLNHTASAWVDAFPAFSNIQLVIGGIDRTVVVGGVDAARYTTDGLYVTDNVVVAQGDYMYHFSVGYLEPDSVIRKDFNAMVDSVRFISPVGGGVEIGTKVDVRVACETALTYMLFQTGEQADQFVTECVAGEHPEVIERYMNQTSQGGVEI